MLTAYAWLTLHLMLAGGWCRAGLPRRVAPPDGQIRAGSVRPAQQWCGAGGAAGGGRDDAQ